MVGGGTWCSALPAWSCGPEASHLQPTSFSSSSWRGQQGCLLWFWSYSCRDWRVVMTWLWSAFIKGRKCIDTFVGFCWMEIVCVLCFVSSDTMDQSRKRIFSPMWDHFDLITQNRGELFLFSFPLLIIFLSGYYTFLKKTRQISGCSTGSTICHEAGTSPATDGRTIEEINECGVN